MQRARLRPVTPFGTSLACFYIVNMVPTRYTRSREVRMCMAVRMLAAGPIFIGRKVNDTLTMPHFADSLMIGT